MGQPYVDDDEAQRRVQSLYLFAQSKTHSSGRNVKFLYYTGSYETIAAWVSGVLLLYYVAPKLLFKRTIALHAI